MTICQKVKFPNVDICSGDLNKYISIYHRSLGTTRYNGKAKEDFLLVKNVFAAVKTPSGMERFNGVNLNIREGKLITHIFYIYYDRDLLQTFAEKPILENGNYYLELNKNPNIELWTPEQYRVISVINDHENNKFFQIFTSNRGDQDKRATDG